MHKSARFVAAENREKRKFAILGFHKTKDDLRKPDVARVRLFKSKDPLWIEDVDIPIPDMPEGYDIPQNALELLVAREALKLVE